MATTNPFDWDDRALHEGSVHVASLLAENRQRMVPLASKRQRSLAVVGAGVMGTAIGAAAVARGFEVRITDADEATRLRTAEAVAQSARDAYGSMSGSVRMAEDLGEIGSCGIVIEAVVEDERRKATLLRELDRRMTPESLLATNTSTIPIKRLARGLQNPERLCGTHFFLPLPERAVVEVIFTDRTSPAAKSAAIGLSAALGRDVLLAPDAVGFIVNRLMMPYVSEAMQLLTEGVEARVIEDAAVRFGMPKGPLALLDEIGLDTALDCGWVFAGAYEDRVAVSPLLVAMVKAGRLGRKTGAGFFRYRTGEDGRVEQQTDPAVAEIVARWAGRKMASTGDTVAARLFLPMVFEAARILEEHGECRAADIDLGVVLGLGMAPTRGGPLYWCDRVGAGRLLQMAEPLKPLGPRMAAPGRLEKMAKDAGSFYG